MKTVLITGGARRLGRALVEWFAHNDWQILFTSQWSYEAGIELVGRGGGNVHCIRAQVSTQSNAALVATWARQHTSQIDLLVCNASTFKRTPVLETRPDDFEDLLGSNLIGPYFLAQQCFPLLKQANGSVVNIADAQVQSGMPGFAVYAAAKSALISITKSMALEFAPDIRVNAVLPGTLQWPETEDQYSPSARKTIESKIPLGRIGEWSDVVQAVDFLERSAYMTGVLLPVDGGRSAVF